MRIIATFCIVAFYLALTVCFETGTHPPFGPIFLLKASLKVNNHSLQSGGKIYVNGSHKNRSCHDLLFSVLQFFFPLPHDEDVRLSRSSPVV